MMNPNGQSPDAQNFLMTLLNALFGGQRGGQMPGGMSGGMGAPPMGGGQMPGGMPPSGMGEGMPPSPMGGGMGVPQLPRMNLPGSIDKPNAGPQPVGQSPYAHFNRGLPRQGQ